ncbi:MAG: hypothetical protein WA624_20275 [Methylocella sp.]
MVDLNVNGSLPGSQARKKLTVADIRLREDFFEKRTIDRLDDGSPLGALLRLWLHAAARYHDGNLREMTVDQIEHAARWGRRRGQRPGGFVALLTDVGLLDRTINDDGTTSFVLREWAEWQPYASGKQGRIENGHAAADARWHRPSGENEHDASTKPTQTDQKVYAKNEKVRANPNSGDAASNSGSNAPNPTHPNHSNPEGDYESNSQTKKEDSEFELSSKAETAPSSFSSSVNNGTANADSNSSVRTVPEAEVADRVRNLKRLMAVPLCGKAITIDRVTLRLWNEEATTIERIAANDVRYPEVLRALEKRAAKARQMDVDTRAASGR